MVKEKLLKFHSSLSVSPGNVWNLNIQKTIEDLSIFELCLRRCQQPRAEPASCPLAHAAISTVKCILRRDSGIGISVFGSHFALNIFKSLPHTSPMFQFLEKVGRVERAGKDRKAGKAGWRVGRWDSYDLEDRGRWVLGSDCGLACC